MRLPSTDLLIRILVIRGKIALLAFQIWRARAIAKNAAMTKQFENLLGEITSSLIKAPNDRVDGQLHAALDRVRKSLRLEWISLFTCREASDEFFAIGTSAQDHIAGSTLPRFEQLPWAMGQLRRGEAVYVDCINQLPEEAVEEKKLLENTAAESLIGVPLLAHRSRSTAGILIVTTKQHPNSTGDLLLQLQILGRLLYQIYSLQSIEETVDDLKERFSLAVDKSPVMIWMSDANKLCTYVNQGWLAFTGRKIEDEMGSGWAAGVHPEDVGGCIAWYTAAFEAHEKFQLEYRLRRFDGEYRWIINYGAPRYAPDGTFCGYIGSCIDITESRRSENELKELSMRLIDAQENERQRIARELHDDFSQQLTLLALELAKLNDHSNRDSIVGEVVVALESRIRSLAVALNSRAHELHSSHLETLGLSAAIQSLCRDFSQQHEINVDFRQDAIPSHLPPNVSLCLFRIVQEGLQNVAKHSHTKNCCVELFWENTDILLRIADSGVGFDPSNPDTSKGIGMISMRERLRQVSGDLRVVSSPNRGTRLEVRVPFGRISASA